MIHVSPLQTVPTVERWDPLEPFIAWAGATLRGEAAFAGTIALAPGGWAIAWRVGAPLEAWSVDALGWSPLRPPEAVRNRLQRADGAWSLALCDGPLLRAYACFVVDHALPRGARAAIEARAAEVVDTLRAAAAATSEAPSGDVAALCDALSEPAWLLDARHQIVFANEAGLVRLERDTATVAALERIGRGAADERGFVRTSLHATGACMIRDVGGACAEERLARAERAWRLTRRQAEVLAGLVAGGTNRQIAEELGIAEVTVEVHVTGLFRRAGVGSRVELVSVVLGGMGV